MGDEVPKEKLSQAERTAMLLAKHQRDINRVNDSDKATRKRGLEKLLSDLPWEKKSTKKAFGVVFHENLLVPLLVTLDDAVEKCRDVSLKLIRQALSTFPTVKEEAVTQIVEGLCARVGEVPFTEPTEELRLTVLEVLGQVLQHDSMLASPKLVQASCMSVVVALSKAAADAFPSAKREAADLLCTVVRVAPEPWALAGALKDCLKSLCANAMHQHNKVRAATLRALLAAMSCFNDDYQAVMRDQVVGLLHRVLGDRNVGTRREAARTCAGLVTSRLMCGLFTAARQPGVYPPRTGENIIEPTKAQMSAALDGTWAGGDVEALKLLLVLIGDESADVKAEATSGMAQIALLWAKNPTDPKGQGTFDFAKDPDAFTGDAEMELGGAQPPAPPTAAEEAEEAEEQQQQDTRMAIECSDDEASPADAIPPEEALARFTRAHLRILVQVLVVGVDGWTVDGQCRFLGGLESLVTVSGRCEEASEMLPVLLAHLGAPLRDDEASVRRAAERCTACMGKAVPWADLADVLLPRAEGTVAGGDTASGRATAIRLLTAALDGASASDQPPPASELPRLLACVSQIDMYEHRELYLREAAFILVRVIIRTFPTQLKTGWPAKAVGAIEASDVRAQLGLALVLLCTTIGGESDVVKDAALAEAAQLSVGSGGEGGCKTRLGVLAPYFSFFLTRVAPEPTSMRSSEPWSNVSPAKAAYDVLLRELPAAAWAHHDRVMPVIYRQIIPPVRVDKDSAEGIEKMYAAQRGEEAIPELKDVDVRLALLALLEALVRTGAADWESGKFMGAAAELILTKAVVPNLVWRVGRVEATVRKVALAVCHGLLRAGATLGESVFKAAPHLVPLLASNLDDMEASPRAMACMCLQVCFQRLKGAFGSEAVHELYPKLLKRLDDSSDQVCLFLHSQLAMTH